MVNKKIKSTYVMVLHPTNEARSHEKFKQLEKLEIGEIDKVTQDLRAIAEIEQMQETGELKY